MDPRVFAGLLVAVLGGTVAALSVVRARHTAPDIGEFLEGLDRREPTDEYHRRLVEPFSSRVLGGLGRRLHRSIERFLPGPYLEGLQRKLLLAGLGDRKKPAEHLLAQLLLAAVAAGLGILYVVSAGPSLLGIVMALGLLPTIGFMLPSARLSRKIKQRSQAILDDLPDTLDLLAISVEAGMGFEGAIAIVCENFTSPLADEFSIALLEMELGLTRREAFQNIKRRTDVPALSSFILAMLQADALGIPVGRVLKTQATEMRSQRRQWAREKAAKLPVKILVPLVLFIFPPILIIVLGPAGLSLGNLG